MSESKYQTISFAGITLSPDAQIAICSMQMDEDKVICDNLGEIALRLCEVKDDEKAPRTLELVHSILLSRDYIAVIGKTDPDE